MQSKPLLIEILTEELPPKSLDFLMNVFYENILKRFQEKEIHFTHATAFSTPRRLSLLIKEVSSHQNDQSLFRKGPAKKMAFSEDGSPTKACLGFTKSLGIEPKDLVIYSQPQGEWVAYQEKIKGKSLFELLPVLLEETLLTLPIPKKMRWGDKPFEFVRPVHGVVLLYGSQVIEATILGCVVSRVTKGHRFEAKEDFISILNAESYVTLLLEKGHVIVEPDKRRRMIVEGAANVIQEKMKGTAHAILMEDALLQEVAGLVEWPTALCGTFAERFLSLPKEILISTMQDHQRYFPVIDANNDLLPYFITISNISSKKPSQVVQGNERVLEARLRDAAFFYENDKKESLFERVDRLRTIIFHAKLGNLYEKVERLKKLAAFCAKKWGLASNEAIRAATLCKSDLTTQMVEEFPELQGVMGYYYALYEGEEISVASALKHYYLPRFAKDSLPHEPLGQLLAVVDRIDTLSGYFGISEIPTGEKDPYGLRRAALGVIRILIEKEIDLDLKEVILLALETYQPKLSNPDADVLLLSFINDRLRAWYQEKGIAQDVLASVKSLSLTHFFKIHKRIEAVQSFKGLPEFHSLTTANKRVSNLLSKYQSTLTAQQIDETLFAEEIEKTLADALNQKQIILEKLEEENNYIEMLKQLATLSTFIDSFFEKVMILCENPAQRDNRLLLLQKLRNLFLKVADISFLQIESPEHVNNETHSRTIW